MKGLTKKDLRKQLTAWKNGKVTKREIDVALGHGSWNGKFIDRQWRDRLGVATTGRSKRSVVELAV